MQELHQLARKGRFAELETAWMQALEGEIASCEDFLAAAESLVKQKQRSQAESLLWYLVSAFKEREQAQVALDVVQRAAALLPESAMLRDEGGELYLTVQGRTSEAETVVRMTLGNKALRLDEAMKQLKLVEQLKPGTCVREDPGARFGRVDAMNADRMRLVVTFEDGVHEYDVASAARLQVVPPNDFRTLAVFERDRLSALAEQNPEELIALMLNTFGGRLGVDRLKRHIQPLLRNITWPKWWGNVKRLAEHSSVIGITAGAKPDLFMRSQPVQREERLADAFDAGAPLDKIARALRLLSETPQDAEAHRALMTRFAEGLAVIARAPQGQSPAVALAALAVLDEIRRRHPELALPPAPDAGPLLESANLVEAIASDIGEEEVLTVLLGALQRWLPERWQDLYARAMPLLGRDACNEAARGLADAQAWQVLAGVARQLLSRPDSSAGALIWLWKACEAGHYELAFKDVNPAAVLRQMLASTASLARAASGPKEERKRQIAQIRQALLGGSREFFGKVFQAASEDDARAILNLAERGSGFSSHGKADLLKVMRGYRPEFFLDATPIWEEDVIYTTAAGVERRKKELDHIVHERLPAVIREVGEAARLGDLSENAEFTAAVEERARLSKLSASMQEELLKARVLAADLARVPYVTVGSRVRARNLETGKLETLTFLGPWDADPAAGIYSYRAPLSLAFMGAEVGATVKFSSEARERRWEIVEIEPALAK